MDSRRGASSRSGGVASREIASSGVFEGVDGLETGVEFEIRWGLPLFPGGSTLEIGGENGISPGGGDPRIGGDVASGPGLDPRIEGDPPLIFGTAPSDRRQSTLDF
jgi:hypothetical protein